MTDSDYLAAYAAQLDAEPECRCVETDRGTDTFGCALHDAARPRPTGRRGG